MGFEPYVWRNLNICAIRCAEKTVENVFNSRMIDCQSDVRTISQFLLNLILNLILTKDKEKYIKKIHTKDLYIHAEIILLLLLWVLIMNCPSIHVTNLLHSVLSLCDVMRSKAKVNQEEARRNDQIYALSDVSKRH